jgi:hypothetical protein
MRLQIQNRSNRAIAKSPRDDGRFARQGIGPVGWMRQYRVGLPCQPALQVSLPHHSRVQHHRLAGPKFGAQSRAGARDGRAS